MNAEYRGVNGVARRIVKEYRGVNGVARRVLKAYRGVNGVARRYLGSAYTPWFRIVNAGEASGLVQDLGSFAGYNNGAILLRSYASIRSNTDDKRIYSHAIIPCSDAGGKTVNMIYDLSSNPGYYDGVVYIGDTSGNTTSVYVLYQGNNINFSCVLPYNVSHILLEGALGTYGTNDIYLNIKSLKIGNDIVI